MNGIHHTGYSIPTYPHRCLPGHWKSFEQHSRWLERVSPLFFFSSLGKNIEPYGRHSERPRVDFVGLSLRSLGTPWRAMSLLVDFRSAPLSPSFRMATAGKISSFVLDLTASRNIQASLFFRNALLFPVQVGCTGSPMIWVIMLSSSACGWKIGGTRMDFRD